MWHKMRYANVNRQINFGNRWKVANSIINFLLYMQRIGSRTDQSVSMPCNIQNCTIDILFLAHNVDF